MPPPPPPPPKAVSATPLEGLSIDTSTIGIAGALLGAFAVGTFLMRGREEEGGTSASAPSASSAPSATSASGVDVSIPYDAAAKLAYEASDKSMAYPDFKAKYEADAVADVKAKQ
jgi:hypothetical protein